MKKIITMAIISAVFIFLPARAESPSPPSSLYKYAHNDAEYSVVLPEAPTVRTIWGDEGPVPYLDHPPKDGALGEVATFRRVDPKTEDVFDVQITYLKADYDFLDNLTDEKIKGLLANDFKDSNLDGQKIEVKKGQEIKTRGETIILKWLTLTGFSRDESERPIIVTEHFLTGQQSILVVRVRYNIENKTFEDFYNQLAANITYYTP